MKIAVVLLALVAVSLGYHLNAPSQIKPRTEVTDDPSGEFTNPPKRLTMPELFTFPGSKFVEDVLVMMMLRPLPKDPSFIGEVSDPKVAELEEMMLDMHEKFGEWTGIPTMVSMKMTEWLAENIFACPLIVYDKIFVNLIQASLKNAFSSLRGTMASNLETITLDVFPDLEDEERIDMVSDASQEVFKWIREELRDNFLAQVIRDAAEFSHTFYNALVDEVESFDGENIPTGFLKTVLDISLFQTDVVCESDIENDDTFKQGIQALTKKLEMQGTVYWINKLEEYFMDQLPIEQQERFSIDESHLEKVAKEIASFITEFLELVGANNEKIESTADLEGYLVQALGKDYSNFVTVLLEKMGETHQDERKYYGVTGESRDIMPSKRRYYGVTGESRDMPSKRRRYGETDEPRDIMPSKRRYYGATDESRDIMPSKRRYNGVHLIPFINKRSETLSLLT